MILAECEGVGVHKHPQTTCGVFGASMIGYQYQLSVFAPNIDMDTLKKGDAHTLSFESFEPFDQTGECNDWSRGSEKPHLFKNGKCLDRKKSQL